MQGSQRRGILLRHARTDTCCREQIPAPLLFRLDACVFSPALLESARSQIKKKNTCKIYIIQQKTNLNEENIFYKIERKKKRPKRRFGFYPQGTRHCRSAPSRIPSGARDEPLSYGGCPTAAAWTTSHISCVCWRQLIDTGG